MRLSDGTESGSWTERKENNTHCVCAADDRPTTVCHQGLCAVTVTAARGKHKVLPRSYLNKYNSSERGIIGSFTQYVTSWSHVSQPDKPQHTSTKKLDVHVYAHFNQYKCCVYLGYVNCVPVHVVACVYISQHV